MHVTAVTVETASHVLILTNVSLGQITVMVTLLAQTLEVHSPVHVIPATQETV